MISRDDVDAGRVDFSDLAQPGEPRQPPVTPGEVLKDWMDDVGLSANALARAMRVPPNRISAILKAERAITAETALRLGRFFGTTPKFWLNLQMRYDLAVAEERYGRAVEREVLPRAA